MSLSYKEIPPTESKTKIEKTKEYVDYRSELMEKVRKGELVIGQLPALLNKLLDDIKKYMHRKKRNNKQSEIKEINKIEETQCVAKSYNECELTDLSEEETYLLEYNSVSIRLPSALYYERTKENLRKSIEIKENDNVIYFTSLQVTGSTVFNSFTKKTRINDEVVYNIEKEVKDIIKKIPNYEDSSRCEIKKIGCTLSINRWECIDNWWSMKRENVIIRKFKDFHLFLASDKTKNCVKQCIEYLKEEYDENKTIEEMLSHRKIITYTPLLEDMNYVEKMDDLVADYDEDIQTTDCKNIVRLLKFNGHVGIIIYIKQKYYRAKYQTSRRLIIKEEESTEVFMDIESLTEKIDDKNKRQVPYLICWNEGGNDINRSVGKNCIQEFVEKMMLLSMEKGDIIIYAWYGSGYDFQHILPYLKQSSTSTKFIIKNSSVIYAELINSTLNTKIILKDPYLFLLCSLDKAAKAFKVMNKGSFPHSLIKSWSDLDIVLDNWVKINQRIIVSKDDNKVGMVVKREEYLTYEQNKNYETILEKAISYCEIDVYAMKEVWLKFKKLVFENLGMTINTKIFTLSQLSMRLMESCLPKHVSLVVPSKEEYEFLKDAIYGGRVYAKNGIYEEDILYADVVSLYPSAMRLLNHCYGNPKDVTTIDWNKMGIYEVKLTHEKNSQPNGYLNFVPRRIDGKLSWKWFKETIGTYHTYDLMIAKQEGFSIECIRGVEYASSGKIFNKYIDRLYHLKDVHSSCDCGDKPCPIRMIAKIALNGGGYGKFVQKPIDRDVYIVKRDIVADQIDKLKTNEDGKICLGKSFINKPYFYNLDGDLYDKMIIEKDESPVYATQNGISILSGSRYRLYKLCKEFPGIEIIYSDTDSLYIKKNSVDYEKFKKSCNTSLGSLDDNLENSKDGIINRMIIGGPKMYGYEYLNKQEEKEIKLYCKGIPNDMLSIEHLESLMNNNTIAYEFDILKRRLVTINTMTIIKKIRET